MKIYIAGENHHGIDPNAEKVENRSDKDLNDLAESYGIEFNRLVSFFYKKQAVDNIRIKKELEAKRENKPN